MNPRSVLWRALVLLAGLSGGGIGGAMAGEIEGPHRVSVSDVVALRELVGRQGTVLGHVTATSVSRPSGYHFLNFDNREFSVVCFAADAGNFPSGGPAELYKGRDVEITGLIERYQDKLQIRLREPAQIKLAKPTSAHPAPSAAPVKVELKKIGVDTWISPAGLRYQGRDPDGRTRVDHILRHAGDMPQREGSHGVFDGGPDAVFGVIDEAWKKVEKQKLRPTIEGDRSLYTVPMGRRVGYLGGQTGASRGHPPLSSVFLVIETGTKNVVTAFPK